MSLPSRRVFMAALAGMLMAPEVSARLRTAPPYNRHIADALDHAHWAVGVQLWTVNAEMQINPAATLKALKDLGFETVETAGLYGLTAAALRARIEDAGLACKSYHASMADLMISPEAHMANARTLGATWIVCASPMTPQPLDPSRPWLEAIYNAMTPDAWKRNAEQLAKLVPQARQSGLIMAYHNHPTEFRNFDGVTGFDLLATASRDLRFELDVGWAAAGGCDAVSLLEHYAGRIDLLHVKDMVKDVAAPLGWRSVEVGMGVVDWKSVMAAARMAGVKGYFIEQEPPYAHPALESLRISMKEIRRSKSFR